MGQKSQGNLLIIGGAEDKKGDCEILRHFAEVAGGAKARIVVVTTATLEPEEMGETYLEVFGRLGMSGVDLLDVQDRLGANAIEVEERLSKATGVFFTGGDQLRITSLIGGTLMDRCLHQLYQQGVIIAGTSAGASMMSDIMIVEGASDDAPKKNTVKLAPGLGLLEETVIDQHFAQRGRIGRLLTAVAQNPFIIGIGIDEDTAIAVNKAGQFQVLGSQTVTVIDGRSIQYSNTSQVEPEQPLALTDVRLHVLPAPYGYDLNARQPLLGN